MGGEGVGPTYDSRSTTSPSYVWAGSLPVVWAEILGSYFRVMDLCGSWILDRMPEHVRSERNIRRSLTNCLCLSALLAGSYIGVSTVSAQTVVADFQFNEGKGSVTRSATNNLAGTLGLTVDTALLPVSSTDSPSGNANDKSLLLSGDSAPLVDDSNAPVLNLLTQAMTIEVWAKRDGTDDRAIVGLASYGASYKLGIMTGGELVFTLFGVVDVMSGQYLYPDEWHHLAAAWEPGVGVTFYVDGNATFVEATNSMRAFWHNRFSIGAEGEDNAFKGNLDRMRVHKALLTPEELDSVAGTPKAPLASTVVAYNFNESAMPFHSAVTPDRPTYTTSSEYKAALVAPTWVKDSPTGGDSDYCLEFNGAAAQRVVVDDPNMALNFDPGSFTIEAWVKYGALTGDRSVLFGNNGPGGAVSFSVTAQRKLFATAYAIADVPSNASIPDDGQWHHVAVVHENGKELRFYVDGVLGDTVPFTSGVKLNDPDHMQTSFYIGSENYGWTPYTGRMDRVRVTKGVVAADKLDFRAIPGVDPSAPELSIRTMVEISWATLPAGYKLQATANPADPTSWAFATNTPYLSEGLYKYYVPTTASKMFYRLVKP